MGPVGQSLLSENGAGRLFGPEGEPTGSVHAVHPENKSAGGDTGTVVGVPNDKRRCGCGHACVRRDRNNLKRRRCQVDFERSCRLERITRAVLQSHAEAMRGPRPGWRASGGEGTGQRTGYDPRSDRQAGREIDLGCLWTARPNEHLHTREVDTGGGCCDPRKVLTKVGKRDPEIGRVVVGEGVIGWRFECRGGSLGIDQEGDLGRSDVVRPVADFNTERVIAVLERLARNPDGLVVAQDEGGRDIHTIEMHANRLRFDTRASVLIREHQLGRGGAVASTRRR